MADQPKRDALQLIFSFFLGILLVVFVGVGVFTFYPGPQAPDNPEQERLDELFREQEQIFRGSDGREPTTQEQERLDEINQEIDEINQELSDQRAVWSRNTSIVLIVFATILMIVSLLLPEAMSVISNGTLLGGLFTMVYGTGWSFAGDDSRARFFVVTVALVLTLIFGYLKFVRGRELHQSPPAEEPAPPAPSPPPES